MTNESTMNKLIEMRFTAMADAFRIQLSDNSLNHMSFEERLGLLVDIEYTSRKNNKFHRLIRLAKFDQPHASISDVNYNSSRMINKSQIQKLSTCEYIYDAHNVIIMGATGAGKSYLACALGMEACKRFYSVKYIRLPELLAELAIARGEGNYKKIFSQYKKAQLLILDEWMLISLTENEARDVLEIVHARHKKTSTIFCSQFSPAGWHKKIGEATLADAILDRIVHDSYNIEIHNKTGKDDHSMREEYGLKQNK
ncbi:IS21-like element helper ATPase IstB [Fusibacter ferrireducens]|uniref:ATP-binding protein n=1 Tax=Fusibacter ferrireducens TaxID=2785058 RepID=A0ABS0A1R3_9FIRM|nr:IS21-like element helper ATPase IstB [Fusibacter ferrireducens]MBF4696105.1 ATP-binding protein [Fusibacter ferrireducens]